MTVSRKRLNNLDGKEWVKATKSWFIVNPRSRSSAQIKHPAKYPEELVVKFLEFFTKEGSWVLDPFAGVGSTGLACKMAGRNFVGIELSQEFVDLGNGALVEIEGFSRQVLGQRKNA